MVSMTRIRFQLTSRGKSINCLRKHGVQEDHKENYREERKYQNTGPKKENQKQISHKIMGCICVKGRTNGQIGHLKQWMRVPLIAQLVKNLPAMQETWARFLGRKIPWRRKWQPTPVFLSGESHGLRSLAGYSPWIARVGQNLATENTKWWMKIPRMWSILNQLISKLHGVLRPPSSQLRPG